MMFHDYMYIYQLIDIVSLEIIVLNYCNLFHLCHLQILQMYLDQYHCKQFIIGCSHFGDFRNLGNKFMYM